MPKSSAKESACSRNNYISNYINNYIRLSAGCTGRGAGAHLAGGSGLERSPISDARKAAPSVITRAAKCSTAAQAAGSPDVHEERNYRTRVRLYPGSLLKSRTALPRPEEFLASFCLIKLAFLLKFQQRDVPPFHCSCGIPFSFYY